MVVRLGGLGNRLDAMYEFHARHGIKPQRGLGKELNGMYEWHRAGIETHHGRGKYKEGRHYIRWCFADAVRPFPTDLFIIHLLAPASN